MRISDWSSDVCSSDLIRRTAYGIPHIRAQDEASLGFGMGYAYAQDNLCMLADEMVTVNSRRSEFFGPELIAGPDIDSGYTHSTNRNLDLFFKLVKIGRAHV